MVPAGEESERGMEVSIARDEKDWIVGSSSNGFPGIPKSIMELTSQMTRELSTRMEDKRQMRALAADDLRTKEAFAGWKWDFNGQHFLATRN